MSKSKTPEPQELQSIDPSQLQNVGGGAARASAASSDSSEITAALTGVMDALGSLKNNQQGSGFGPSEMMMFMMMLGGGGRRQQSAPMAAPANGGYAGYTIDGVFYPFK